MLHHFSEWRLLHSGVTGCLAENLLGLERVANYRSSVGNQIGPVLHFLTASPYSFLAESRKRRTHSVPVTAYSLAFASAIVLLCSPFTAVPQTQELGADVPDPINNPTNGLGVWIWAA